MAVSPSRAIKSIVAGFAIGMLPLCLSNIPLQARWLQAIAEATAFLLLPGAVLGYALTLGRIHDIPLAITVGGSCAFYSAVFYFSARHRSAKTPAQ